MEGLKFREFNATDFKKGFFETLAALREVTLPDDAAKNLFQMMLANPYMHVFIATVTEGSRERVIGTVSVEFHVCFRNKDPFVACINDVAVHREFHGKGVGAFLMQHVLDFIFIQEKRKYKAILDCSIENAPFYEKFGFRERGKFMELRAENYEPTT